MSSESPAKNFWKDFQLSVDDEDGGDEDDDDGDNDNDNDDDDDDDGDDDDDDGDVSDEEIEEERELFDVRRRRDAGGRNEVFRGDMKRIGGG